MRLIIIVVIIIIIGILLVVFSEKPENKILKYIKSLEFINSDDTFLYSKQISKNNLEQHSKNVEENIDSEYEILYFNINTYQLTKDKISYSDGITKNFTPTLDYTNNNLRYTYRISLDNTNVIMEGSFNMDTEEFTCTPSFSYQIDIENSKKDICNKIKYDVESFNIKALKIFKKIND